MIRLITLIALLGLISGCATVPQGAEDPRDPLQGFNRSMYQFNDSLDNAIIKPVAKGYRTVVPHPIDYGITNAFGNLQDVVTTINDILQLKLLQAGSDAVRVLVNSTMGLLGLFDVATEMGFTKHREDFGQTLGYWGVGEGAYLVLPVLGSSTIRDTVGIIVDVNFDPLIKYHNVSTRNAMLTLKLVDTRSDLLSASKVLQQAALDPYDFVKEAYFQQRENDIQNGDPHPPSDHPPPEK